MDTSYTVKDCVLVDIPTFTDERGAISVMDKELPFEVKRVFWLHYIQEGKDRGDHALLCGTEIICCMHGSFIVKLFDGKNKNEILLDSPRVGLLIRPGIWFSIHSYKDDGVTLVLASEAYEKGNYTYDINNYLNYRKSNEI